MPFGEKHVKTLRKRKEEAVFSPDGNRVIIFFGLWAAEWGLFNGMASNKAGVAILFNNNFSFKILKQFCDKEGRCIITDLEVGELTLTICNIYAPNMQGRSEFF